VWGSFFWLGVREKEGRVITALAHLFTPPSTAPPLPQNKKKQFKKHHQRVLNIQTLASMKRKK
jgi:hypothetical protein